MNTRFQKMLNGYINDKDDHGLVVCADTLYSCGELTDAEHTALLEKSHEIFNAKFEVAA